MNVHDRKISEFSVDLLVEVIALDVCLDKYARDMNSIIDVSIMGEEGDCYA